MLTKVNQFYMEFLNIVPNWIKLAYTVSDGPAAPHKFVLVVDAQNLLKVLFFFKSFSLFRFNYLVDSFCVDYQRSKDRFELNYILTSTNYFEILIIKVFTSSVVPSLSNLFHGSSWLEREMWDLYGVFFLDHPDLRRILTDYGFDGYPLRKDFPISGYKEVRYDDTQKRVLLEPLSLLQEFRYFDFVSPWERINR